jgi:hypothetical protein
MKTKHTFAFTFVLGLVWTITLFANSLGPPVGVNGVVGANCNQFGCHTGNAVNVAGGSVTIGGLPATWTAGQTYDLTVTVSKSGASRYGFQFSAVSDSSGAQAGTLLAATSNDARVQFISGDVSGNTLQFAEHTSSFFSPTSPFRFRWTAPSSASFGTVRFNVAGNAANNDGTNSGDFIYTSSTNVSAAAPADTTAPVISAVTSSSVTSAAATIAWTTDEASDSQVEYGTTTAYGSTTTLNTSMVTSHSVNITGLASNTKYHYRVKSRDAASNLATGADNTFMTGFSITNLGGVSRSTDGSGSTVIGYARIQSTSGTTPSGVGIFGYRTGGVLVSEAGVPDSPLVTSGRIYAEVNSATKVNTGLAIANPNSTLATITFEIRDTTGALVTSGVTTVGANSQIAGFLDQTPYSSPNVQGTFTFTSTQSVSVIALRSFLNERSPSDFLITTLPVVPTTGGGLTGTQVIPHFAVGGGWTTQIVLVNPTATDQTGTVSFFSQGSGSTAGAATSVTIDGVAGSSTAYTVKGNSSKKFVITGTTSTVTGSVRVVPSASAVPTPMVIFSYKPSTITVSEAGVPVTMGTTFRMFAQTAASPQVLSGVAVSNATAVQGTVTLTFTPFDGSPSASSAPQNLPPSGQIAGFLGDFIPSLSNATTQGVLQISTNLSSISVVGLRARYNERGDFLITTTPPSLENGTPSTAEKNFPHLANGDGWTTQFVLFSGTSGQASGGTLSLVSQGGASLDLNIN